MTEVRHACVHLRAASILSMFLPLLKSHELLLWNCAHAKWLQFWKSHAMHWCEYCKVWMNDNPATKATHENGLKHKENVSKSESSGSSGKLACLRWCHKEATAPAATVC